MESPVTSRQQRAADTPRRLALWTPGGGLN